MTKILIVNIVASTKLNSKIAIEKLARNIKGALYEPEIFPGLYYRLPNKQATMTLFASGKIVSTGSKSEETAKNSINQVIYEIKKILNIDTSMNEIKIENIVSTINLEKTIKLEKLTMKLAGSRLDLEEFPCIFYPFKEKITLLIFRSGKIVSVGAKSEKTSRESLTFIKKIIKEFL